MIAEPTAKLAVDINHELKQNFVKKIESMGQTQRFVVERMVREYLLNEETNGKATPERHTSTKTKRRTRVS